MKKILILGGKPIGSVEIVKRAKESGYYTIVADYLAPSESQAKLISDESWEISTSEVDTLVAMCKEHGVDGVTTGVHEFNINRMLELCEATGMPCYCKRDTWVYCDNKVLFKELCQKNDIPVALKHRFDDRYSLEYPVITKPVDGSGSRGFHICNNVAELEKAYQDSMKFSPTGNVLIEDYVPYDAVIIHYTMVNGRCIYSGMSDKVSVKFANTGSSVMGIQTFPSVGEDYYLEHLDGRVRAMFENAGFTDGPVWIEAFFNKRDKFIFNEMGYRFGGSLTYYPVKYFHNIDQLDLLLKNAMGEDAGIVEESSKKADRKYCILPIHIHAGVITEVSGEEEIMNREDVNAYVPVHFKGETIHDWGSAQQVFCYMHILYDTVSQLKESINSVMTQLKAYDASGKNMLFTLFDINSIPNE